LATPVFEEERVSVTAFGGKNAPGLLRIRVWSGPQRAARTAKALLGCWVLSALSLFIPVAHFFLVPGFFVAGIVLAVRRAGEGRTLVQLRGACPRCGREEPLGLRGKALLPKEIQCPGCSARLVLRGSAPNSSAPGTGAEMRGENSSGGAGH
jgi:DNA-directed RNA polymerase subunit RPC12/RpoP